MALNDRDLAPEEREQKKYSATKGRIIFLSILVCCTLVARIVFKNPPPPKAPDHSNKPFRALPGVLNTLSIAQRSKLTPQQIAKLVEADMNAYHPSAKTTALAENVYRPIEAPVPILSQKTGPATAFEYTTKHRQSAETPLAEQVDLSKNTLVRFTHGGYVKAQDASRFDGRVDIKIDRNMRAGISRTMVLSITQDAITWKEPIPYGQVEITPAKGVTLILSKRLANRVISTYSKKDKNEI